MAVRFPELGFYTLPGRVCDPKPMLREVRDKEDVVLEKVRNHPLLEGRLADATELSDDELRQIRDVSPREWLEDGNAVGSPEHCAQRIRDQFAAGAAGVVPHASAPRAMGALLAAYAKVRDGARFAGRAATPGR